jgi:DNA end-binding protein Ku
MASAPIMEGPPQAFPGSCPIALYTTTSSGERVAFRQINKKTGNRPRQHLIDEGTGDPIDPGDKGGGYEVDKGVYLQFEDEELDAVAIESSHTIDIDSFVPKSEIDERFFDSPYYLRRTRSRSRRSRSITRADVLQSWCGEPSAEGGLLFR